MAKTFGLNGLSGQCQASISILIGCYFCQSCCKIMTGHTAGSKWSLILHPLGHNKLPFTCIQIKYIKLVRQGDRKRCFFKMILYYSGMWSFKMFFVLCSVWSWQQNLWVSSILKQYCLVLFPNVYFSSLEDDKILSTVLCCTVESIKLNLAGSNVSAI